MRSGAFITDYDGTLAHEGRVGDAACVALEKLRSGGTKLILATGRRLRDLQAIFPRLDLFDRIVAENGGILYEPGSDRLRLLTFPASAPLYERLHAAGVDPLEVGHAIIATRDPYGAEVLRAIEELKLKLALSFNKGAIMILPDGVNKATGLDAALSELRLSWADTLGVGDAENDFEFLKKCGVSAAVANALPELKAFADLVTEEGDGAGVAELAARILRQVR